MGIAKSCMKMVSICQIGESFFFKKFYWMFKSFLETCVSSNVLHGNSDILVKSAKALDKLLTENTTDLQPLNTASSDKIENPMIG